PLGEAWMLVSVAICTWNRAKLLDQTLAELHKLCIPTGVTWELLVVNNNSSDETEAVIARHSGPLPIRRLFEPQQGLCHARNCAVAAAQGELLLWTDDDVLVHPDWIAEYVKASCAWPKASFFGGTIDPWFVSPPPRWVLRHLDLLFGPYAIRQLGEDIRPFAGDETPFGASMGFRTEVARAHLYDVRLGHIGKSLIGGEETDLFARLSRAGHTGVWVGTARVQHYIPAERLHLGYVWSWFRSKGKEYQRQGVVGAGKVLWGAPRWGWKKYWLGRVAVRWLAPFKGPGWFKVFRDTAVCQGIIEESRAAATLPAALSQPICSGGAWQPLPPAPSPERRGGAEEFSPPLRLGEGAGGRGQ